jgi:hypothetical protein
MNTPEEKISEQTDEAQAQNLNNQLYQHGNVLPTYDWHGLLMVDKGSTIAVLTTYPSREMAETMRSVHRPNTTVLALVKINLEIIQEG